MAVTSGYTNKAAITIDNTKVSGSSNLTDHPVLISGTYAGSGSDPDLRTTGNGGDVTSSSGFDVEFSSDEAGDTDLSHEVVRYNATTGEVIIWVKIPTLSHNSNTVIYMHYGNSSVTTSTADASGLWTGYTGVWHMQESTGSLVDSTGNGNTLAVSQGTPSYQQDGKFGYSISFSTAGFWKFPMHAAASTEWTVDSWAYPTSTPSLATILYTGDWGEMSHRHDGSNFRHWSSWQPSATFRDILNKGTVSTNTWYYEATTAKAGGTGRGFINGAEEGSVSLSGLTGVNNPAGDFPVSIGVFRNSGGTHSQNFAGRIQSVRMQPTEQSADWVATQYNTMSDPASFYSIETLSAGHTLEVDQWQVIPEVKTLSVDEWEFFVGDEVEPPSGKRKMFVVS